MLKKISIIILILTSVSFSFVQKEITVVSSNYNSLIIEYTPLIDTSSIIIDYQKFYSIKLNDGKYPTLPGVASVPFKIFNVGVPSEIGNTIEVLQSTYKVISGMVIPVPHLSKENGLAVPEYRLTNEYSGNSNSNLVDFAEFGYLREMPVQNIAVYPVDFDPGIQQIKIYTKIIFRINFSNAQNFSVVNKKDELLKGSVINYEAAVNWSKSQNKIYKTQFNSVLSAGKWFKFEAPQEGIYKINRSQLSSMGIDPSSVDPRTIKIYNNSGKPLPENIIINVPLDLNENAILVKGEEDGRFDEGDYIIFYGRGTSFWEFDSLTRRIERRSNPYSKENFYWITSGGSAGKRMESKNGSQFSADIIQTKTKAFRFLEDEKINIVRSGRIFLGDEFNETVKSRTYMNQLNWRISGTPVDYEFRFINSDSKTVNLKVDEQGNTIYNKNIYGTNYVTEPDYTTGNPTDGKMTISSDLPENRSILKFTFDASGLLSKGYMDYFDIRYEGSLSAVDDELIFYAPDTAAAIEYQLNNFSGSSDLAVYDISDYSNVKLITNPVMISLGEFRFRSDEQKYGGGKYIAAREIKYKSPVNAVEAGNSNVHGLPEAQYIIITHRNFMQQALRLKDFRENGSRNKLSAVIADVNEIYNEFSGGLKDVGAIRNFIKYAYDNWTTKPEYVVLFGDGDYDYKNIEGFGKNFVPTYQVYHPGNAWWRNIHHIFSYPTDDFFVRVSGNDILIDLAIGRLNIQSTSDAEKVVSKIIKYEAESGKGDWRNLVTLLADDAYTSKNFEGTLHIVPSEEIALNRIPSSFDINKVYMSLYPVELTSAGRRKPAVTKAYVEAINKGTVLFNFIGHGSPSLWTHEVVFENSTVIPMLKNEKLFFLVAATCDFGYFDNPSDQSGTELLILKDNSGAIGGFTASRPVYAFENSQLAFTFFDKMFKTKKDSGEFPITIGKVYMLLRTSMYDTNDLKYHIFGDPALRLAFPQYSAEINSVNGKDPVQPVELKALGKVHLDGTIKKDSVNWNSYNGEGIISVYDSYRFVKLNDVNYDIRVQGGLIFRGLVSINNGKFTADFTIPKDISYENRNGKIVLYFYNDGTDGITYTQNIFINGTDSSAVNDGKGPELEIFFDNPEFRNAYLINPNSELIIKLSDETGLNTTGTGIGHRLEGVLNDNQSEPIDFSNYFTGDKDTGGKSGQVRYRFSDLPDGDYKIYVKAWDVFNNFSSETEYFSVINSDGLELRDIYNYPNPFRENTVFTFQQNLKTSVDVKIKVYTIAGRLIRNIERYGINEGFVKIDWDGRDEDGNKIANGTYLYKIIVNTTDGVYSRSALGKLVVIY